MALTKVSGGVLQQPINVGIITATSITATTATFSGNVSIAGTLTYEDVTNIDSVGLITARSGIHVTGGSVGIGTDNSLSKLNVLGTQGNWRVDTDTVSSEIQVLTSVPDNTGFRNYRIRTNETIIDTNGSEKVRINSSGNVGIGTDNPISGRGTSGKVLNVYGYGTNSIISVQAIEGVNDRNAILELLASGNGGSAAEIVFGNTDTTPITNSPLVFSSYYSGSTVERARISNTGNFQIANGNLEFSTSGTGIDFSATGEGSGTMTSELLDDYEEGSFTPTFSGSTTNPTISWNTQLGRYTKIGNVCYVEIRLVTANVSGGSGNLTITGLPFSQSANSNLGGAFTKGFVYAWAQDPETFIIFTGGSEILIYRNDSTNTIAQVSDLTSGAANNYCNISGCYITA